MILQMIAGTELEHRFLVLLVLELIEGSPPQEPCAYLGQCYRRIGLVELTLDNSEWGRSDRHLELRSRYRRAERELSEQPWPRKTLTLLQTWAWIKMERSRDFNRGYPSIVFLDRWIPRN